ncbi:EamA family transporter [Pontimicrobium aquaticum]|uniref:DMT family transporter n=1 Tax=Pontimicrobium aquaticum TaxID=2565367 RepID=A0A4U0EVW3_9FLAO|nr:EamA family transporter [Pontimicrobium aquaticum]TJY36097.1 DMT family transporter [Pontimicrobium aquaticum]
MIYLLLSILASTAIFIVFKLFSRYKINTFHSIVANYITACICGLISYESSINPSEIFNSRWFIGAVLLGFLFISVFNLMALTAQRNGLSVASVASKMSVVIPVIFGIYVYNESLGFQKIFGIILALIAVYLTAIKAKSSINIRQGLFLPFILFIGSGVIDASIKYLETTYVPKNGIPIFSATIFGCAAIIGLLILTYKAIKQTFKFEIKNAIGGAFLGVINYYSIVFLLKALQFKGLESSTLFTVNNVAIVMASTLVGLFLFKESISKKNWIGISLAIISILLVTLA